MSGRPIRFFAATLVGWVAVRGFMLWPTAGPVAIPQTILPATFADDAAPAELGPGSPTPATGSKPPLSNPLPLLVRASITGRASVPTPMDAGVALGVPSDPVIAASTSPPPQTILAPPQPAPGVSNPTASRWSASAWFVLRDGRGIAPGLGGGQLGGSQAGLRIAYAIGEARRVAIVGRVATPLKGMGREGAVGVEWRPTGLPVRLVAEYRVSLDGGASGPAAGMIAGTGPAPLAFGFDLETYGQAGVIRRRRTEPYAEGAARLSRPVLSVGKAKVDLGLGGWGGAQRGVERLDIGPSIGVRIPVAGKAIRASLDWRQRVAGNARPGSGPVLVIGSDF